MYLSKVLQNAPILIWFFTDFFRFFQIFTIFSGFERFLEGIHADLIEMENTDYTGYAD